MIRSEVSNSNDDYTQRLDSLLASLPKQGAERLGRSLDRTNSGFEKDLRSPFYKAAPREEIIERCDKEVGLSEFEELRAIDEHEREKIGPMSVMLPYSKRKESVMEYWHQDFNPDEAALGLAVSSVSKMLPSRSLRPSSFDTAFDLMPKDTSLGLPWLTRDRSVASDYLRRATQITSPTEIYPCVLYWRGQSAGLNETPKQRVVWGFDHAETILGATVLYPLINALRARPGFSAWLGDVYVDEAITSLLQASRGRRIISMDFSGFDSSLSRGLLDLVDNILSSWFSSPGDERIILLGQMSDTVPLVVPFEVLGGRSGAMPSGSVLTNMRDTVANLIAGFYAGYRARSPLVDFEVLGDDSVYLYENEMDPESLSEYVKELGLSSNPSKQFVSTTACHFLQRWHSKELVLDGVNRGARSPYRTLSGMLSYERFRKDWNKYMDTARWIMQVENVKNDPRFLKMVRFLRDGDEVLSSGMDPAQVFKAAGGADMVRSVLSIASFPFNVQNPEKVEVFETTRALRSMD